MSLKSLLKNTVLTLLFGVFVILLSISVAILVVRFLPMAMFLRSNADAINGAQGAQFINAVFPVPGAEQSIRSRWSPLLPIFVGVSIARRAIRPLDDLLKRVFPPGQPGASDRPSINNLILPDADRDIVRSFAQGNFSALAKRQLVGKMINISLSLFFLVLVLICLFVTVSLIRKLIYGTNSGTKRLVRGGAQLNQELRALPETMKAVYAEPKKKTVKKQVK